MERVRISDIAEELGLSTATVSNVIHGKTRKISDETVRRVQALLEERQYIPSMAGILLAKNTSRIIGVFVHDHEKYEGPVLEDAFIASSLNALSAEAEAAGQFMMVKRAKRAEDILQFASMWNMDGLVVIGFCRQDYMYLRSHMRIPFVVYDGFCDRTERIVNITIDNTGGGRQVGELMRRLGHRRALCVTDNLEGVDKERIEGFRQGFGPGETEVMVVPMRREERRAYWQREAARFRRATAAFAVSDAYAVELMQFLRESGLKVPEDISVAGFDDTPWCNLAYPALTTVRQDSAQRARVAMERLRELKSHADCGGTVVMPVQLVERDSTAPAQDKW